MKHRRTFSQVHSQLFRLASSLFFLCSFQSFHLLLIKPTDGASLSDHLIIGYSLNEGRGQLVGDSSGNGLVGWVSVPPTTWSSESVGEPGHSLSFRREDRGFVKKSSTSLMTNIQNEVSFSIFLRPDPSWNDDYSGAFLSKRLSSDSKGFEAIYNPSSRQIMLLGSGPLITTSLPLSLDTTDWSHIVGVFNGTQGRIYVNGIDVTDPLNSQVTPVTTTSTSLYLAKRAGGGLYYSGLLDNFRLYGKALSPEEVVQLHQLYFPITSTPSLSLTSSPSSPSSHSPPPPSSSPSSFSSLRSSPSTLINSASSSVSPVVSLSPRASLSPSISSKIETSQSLSITPSPLSITSACPVLVVTVTVTVTVTATVTATPSNSSSLPTSSITPTTSSSTSTTVSTSSTWWSPTTSPSQSPTTPSFSAPSTPTTTPSRLQLPSQSITPSRSASPSLSRTPFLIPSRDPSLEDNMVLDSLPAQTVTVKMAPDGNLYVVSKVGRVFLYQPREKFFLLVLDISSEVSPYGDRGLLDVAFHPSWSTNGYIYLFYTVKRSDTPDGMQTWTWSRVTRYTIADHTPTSRRVLLGATKEDGIPVCSASHAVGTIEFGPDGFLFLSHGDGGGFTQEDFGGDAQCRSLFPTQDIGSFRSQTLESMAGKILRIDPETGFGPQDNPFWVNPTSSPLSGQETINRNRIWALGLRNPFRFSIRPTGSLDLPNEVVIYVADVGWGEYEEINVVRKGDNLGWPCWEGPNEVLGFVDRPPYCGQSNAPNRYGVLKFPSLAYHHRRTAGVGFSGYCICGITIYEGHGYPSFYRPPPSSSTFAVFFSDYTSNWIKVGWFDENDQYLGVTDYGTTIGSSPVQVLSFPSFRAGNILYLSYLAQQLREIGPVSVIPIAKATAMPVATGGVPSVVLFRSDGSFSGGGILTFLWELGDGMTSSLPNLNHTYTSLGVFDVTLTVTNGDGAIDVSTLTIRTSSGVPTVQILSPPTHSHNGERYFLYQPNDIVLFDCDYQTSEPNEIPSILWELQLQHNGHVHPMTSVSFGKSTTFQLTESFSATDVYSYRFVVTVTDQWGVSVRSVIYGFPKDPTAQSSPRADFFTNPTDNSVPYAPIAFDASISTDREGDLLSYLWDFGDGTGLWESGPQSITYHTYSRVGSFPVKLVVMDSWLGRSSVEKVVVVGSQSSTTPSPVVNSTQLQKDLVVFWNFDESNPMTDSSTNDYFIDPKNGATVGPGMFNENGFSLLAIQEQYGDVPSTAGIGSQFSTTLQYQISISVWIRPDVSYDFRRIISKKSGWDATTGFEVEYNPEYGEIGFLGSGANAARSRQRVLRRDVWHHVVCVADGTKATIYLNGTDVTDSTRSTINSIVPSDVPLRIGSFAGTSAFWNGGLDQIRIYNRALNHEEVSWLFVNP